MNQAKKIKHIPNKIEIIPLSLYVHIPWCVKKCPYCDFNSHALNQEKIDEKAYVQALEQDLIADLEKFNIKDPTIHSIFIGGGTPSLFSPEAINTLLQSIQRYCKFAHAMEITLEANPGTVDQAYFSGFKQAGINRLSIGIQSFQTQYLKRLGRIHDAEQAVSAVEIAQKVGFKNINLDLMHGLPDQTQVDALSDIKIALNLEPTHLSWYQLTLEPNTFFYQHPPKLPQEDLLEAIQQAGQVYLNQKGFDPYEVSAYVKKSATDFRSQHNLNYWRFGDYLAIGAGAHGKITNSKTQEIIRYWKVRHPKDYLNHEKAFIAGERMLSDAERPLEFMMNALRLYEMIPIALFEQRTCLTFNTIISQLNELIKKELIVLSATHIQTTALGKRYLNELLHVFLL